MRKIVRMFKNGNVFVVGLRGTGKDMLMANVACRRREPYAGNIDYTHDKRYRPLDFGALDLGGNTYRNFISGDVQYYSFEDTYPLGTDIYISDAGVYFPAQYCNRLNEEYRDFINFPALSRHCGRSNIFCNAQSLGRVWDKLREQADQYIRCLRCVVFGRLVVQRVVIYDQYDACLRRVAPFKVPVRLLHNADIRNQIELAKMSYRERNGTVTPRLLIYWNKSKYDTHHFYNLLKGGKKKCAKS